MIEDLKIINGNLELKFDKYTYLYTVTVDNNINSLEFTYSLADNTYIDIRDNYLDKEENLVYIDVYNNEEVSTYTFYVYKENIEEVSGIDNYLASLEVKNEDVTSLYKIQILSISMFLIIVIIYAIIFRRKRWKK